MEKGEKKLHWTQTPEGKKRMSQIVKNGHKTRKKNSIPRKKVDAPVSREITVEETPVFAYALGYIEAWIEAYAKSADISSETLAAKLGKVLQIKTRR